MKALMKQALREVLEYAISVVCAVMSDCRPAAATAGARRLGRSRHFAGESLDKPDE
ncbi:MAG TPA: hypothetical protein VJ673_19230 [Aromatoleum sp.]|uniref:hypothetical protein n=1 Tax=Aromatoleum sp. TaxID=2307007 RepID=UPI002B482271|nr:hypothetical protein [Aromatoleum sp.]HJV27823.1 hypothetical protein [Aromatoleum sp.]